MPTQLKTCQARNLERPLRRPTGILLYSDPPMMFSLICSFVLRPIIKADFDEIMTWITISKSIAKTQQSAPARKYFYAHSFKLWQAISIHKIALKIYFLREEFDQTQLAAIASFRHVRCLPESTTSLSTTLWNDGDKPIVDSGKTTSAVSLGR